MTRTFNRRRLRLSISIVFLLQMSSAAETPQPFARIGTAKSVDGSATCQPPNRDVPRTMRESKSVFFLDLCKTGPDGRLSMEILDESRFSLAGDSELVFSELVYDPFTKAGTIRVDIDRGSLFFKAGRIARKKSNSAKIAMPAGVIHLLRGAEGVVRLGTFETTWAVSKELGRAVPRRKMVTPTEVLVLSGKVRVVHLGKEVMLKRGRAAAIEENTPIGPARKLSRDERNAARRGFLREK